ncbi:hypothetical protein ES708_23522 [subsurface metagenome]
MAARISSKITILTQKGLRDHVKEKIAPPALFEVIHSGVDTGRFIDADGKRIRIETGWRAEMIVGWAGRLVPIKDCATFIKAAALIRKRCRDVRFLVAGDGEDREGLEKLAGELDLGENIVYSADYSRFPGNFPA